MRLALGQAVAADLLRYGGANQDILWEGFAARGLGEGASSDGPDDDDPVAWQGDTMVEAPERLLDPEAWPVGGAERRP